MAALATVNTRLYAAALEQAQAGQLAQALETLGALLLQAPAHVDGLVVQGKLLAQVGRLDAAIESWQQALDVNPDERRAQEGIARAQKMIFRRSLLRVLLAGLAAVLIFAGGWLGRQALSPAQPPPAPLVILITATQMKLPISSPTATQEISPTPLPQATSIPLTPTATVVDQGCVVQTGVRGGTLYLREGPGTNFAVLGIAREGDRLVIRGEEVAGWWPVSDVAGLRAWVHGEFCR